MADDKDDNISELRPGSRAFSKALDDEDDSMSSWWKDDRSTHADLNRLLQAEALMRLADLAESATSFRLRSVSAYLVDRVVRRIEVQRGTKEPFVPPLKKDPG